MLSLSTYDTSCTFYNNATFSAEPHIVFLCLFDNETMSCEGDAVASPTPIDLAELASRISSLGDTIKLLKSSSEQPDAGAIASAVAALLDAKRTYARTNGGIGLDGKPWEEPMTKSQKKKLEKEKKSAAEASAGKTNDDGDNANEGEHGATLTIDTRLKFDVS